MKASCPLSLKVSLWLLANLLLLAIAGGAFYVSQFGVGWESLTRGALGERLQGIGDSIVSDFNAEPDGARPAILAARQWKYVAHFSLFTTEGVWVAGDPVQLPAAVRSAINRGPRLGRPGPENLRPRLPPPPRDASLRVDRPPPDERDAPDDPPPKNLRPPYDNRFIFYTTIPGTIWIGLRLPIPNEFGHPTPGTLIIHTTSLVALGRLFQIGPWLLIAVGALVLSVVFWLPLVMSITRALQRLTRATERIAEGQFETRVELRRRDELGHLGHSVNRMAEQLQTLVNGQKRFLGDVAHELGSPLGRLQVATEILGTRADAALQAQVADVREEVQHMATLVNELLAFTKAGLRPRDARLAAIALAPLVQRLLEREDVAHRVTAHFATDCHVLADAGLLERALGNLVRNALRYAPSGVIELSTRSTDAHVRVTVSDEGPGVDETALARLGEPFYRPDTARSSEAGGTGLGLAIVKASVVACGGRVIFRNRRPHGFEAEITLAQPEPTSARSLV